jgi:WD40 repeat protein
LYRGARLAVAQDWATGPDGDPTAVEREFLDASARQAEAELAEAREQVGRERRARRRTRRLAIGLAAVLVLTVLVAVQAARFQRDANARAAEIQRSALRGDGVRLAALSETSNGLDLALLLAAQAVTLSDTAQTEDSLLAGLLRHQRALGMVTLPRDVVATAVSGAGTLWVDDGFSLYTWRPPTAAAEPTRVGTSDSGVVDASPTEDLLVGAVPAGGSVPSFRLKLYDRQDDERPLADDGLVRGAPLAVTFTADGRRVDVVAAVVDDQGVAQSWRVEEFDVAGAAHHDTGIGGPLETAGTLAADIDDGGRTAVVSEGTTATLVDLADGRQAQLDVPDRAGIGSRFRALGLGAIQLWSDGALTRYGPDGHRLQQTGGGQQGLLDAVLSPDGTWSATVGAGGAVTLWDVDASTGQWSPRESLAGHTGDVVEAQVVDDGRMLLTRGTDRRVVAWDVGPRAGFGTPVGAAGDRWLAGPPEVVRPGELVVAPTLPLSAAGEPLGAGEVTATFLDPRSGRVVDAVTIGEIDTSFPVTPSQAVSPDRRSVAVSTGLTTRVLDARTHAVRATIELEPGDDQGADGRPLRARPVSCIGWTPDSSRLLLCTARSSPASRADSDLAVVSPSDGEVLDSVGLSGFTGRVIGTDPASGTVAVVTDSVVFLLDGRTLERRGEISFDISGPDAVPDVSFAPGGRRLAVTAGTGSLAVVDVQSGIASTEPVPFGADFVQVEWLPDGRTVALAGSAGTVLLFDTERSQLRVPPLTVGDPAGTPITLVVDGSDALVAVSGGHPGRRLPMAPEAWIAQACAISGHEFTREEWAQYLPDRAYRPVCAR